MNVGMLPFAAMALTLVTIGIVATIASRNDKRRLSNRQDRTGSTGGYVGFSSGNGHGSGSGHCGSDGGGSDGGGCGGGIDALPASHDTLRTYTAFSSAWRMNL